MNDGVAAGVSTGGIYLGAYGWVEQLRPEGKNLQAVELPADLADVVNAHDTAPLQKDPTNLGLIHTPSINHAATAAVLRNAHVAHSGEISVNISSRRVRSALAILEGMRGGQSLGALLGYEFERHVHDNGPLTVRALVYPMRREYPLAANQIAATATSDGDAKESIAAMNVVDGRKLVLHVEQSGADVYPFGNGNLPRRASAEEDAITDAVRYIRDINDAVADLVVSEGVHQAVLGNYDRSAGVLDAFAKGNTPPEPEVIRTPRSGTTLTLRTAVHLPLAGGNPVPAIPITPLAAAEPSLNRWLAERLPDPGDVAVLVDYVDRTTGSDETATITQVDLGLQPADLLVPSRGSGRSGTRRSRRPDPRAPARDGRGRHRPADHRQAHDAGPRVGHVLRARRAAAQPAAARRRCTSVAAGRPGSPERRADGRSGRVDRAARTADRRPDRLARHAPAGTRNAARPRSSTPHGRSTR